ncbi:MAG: aldo/keto reductase [Thiolinea sp.]
MASVYFQHNWQRSFGTYPLTGAELERALATAIDTGYRSFDTAQMYGNEADVGKALARHALDRDAVCITTKVHPDHFSAQYFIPSVQQSLKDLQLDYVDVLLLHWPPQQGGVEQSLHLLAAAQQQGLARHIGVSNYNAALLRQARDLLDVPLVANQVEYHPLLNQEALQQAADETGIPLTSYCSVARGEIFKYPLFAELGEAYGKSAAQIALRWILQKGVPINTMSTQPANIRANFEVMDFTLSSVDMARIGALRHNQYRIVTRAVAPWAPEWD